MKAFICSLLVIAIWIMSVRETKAEGTISNRKLTYYHRGHCGGLNAKTMKKKHNWKTFTKYR